MHMQVSKDLCRLSSELPFDLEECELAMEEDAAGGVDLNKLVKVCVRAWSIHAVRMPCVCRVYAVCVCRVACAWCVCMVCGVVRACGMVWCVRGVSCSCAQGACPARLRVTS